MELSPQAKEHFAKQHIEHAALELAAAEEARFKRAEENRRAYERFYTNLAMFSGGTVALSVTYLGYLKTLSKPVLHREWLVGSWLAFFVCLLCSLFWLFFITHYGHYFRAREYCEAAQKRYETEAAEIQNLNVANIQTIAELEAYQSPRREAAAISKKNAEHNKQRERFYSFIWRCVGWLARVGFVVGFGLLILFAIKNI